jgi:hypothetical protein
MHKTVSVCDITLADYTAEILKIHQIHDISHLPVGTRPMSGGMIDRSSLNAWWLGRSIPASRYGIKDAMEIIGIDDLSILVKKCFGLSLSDQYWICPVGSGLKWNDINFFTNGFSVDVGEILFGGKVNGEMSLISPDNTSDGWLRKKWIIKDDIRYLIKGGSNPFMQEPYNEVIASEVCRRLGITHTDYSLTEIEEKVYCLCANFVTAQTELVPAWRIVNIMKKNNSDSNYTHFLRCCDKLGIGDVQNAIDDMMVLDYIVANEDRHYNNFGFIRDADTLEWQCAAPIFDTGTSLWYNSLVVGSPVVSRPFRKTHEKQIKLVRSLQRYPADALKGLDETIRQIFTGSDTVDHVRREKIAEEVNVRVAALFA